MAIIFSFIMAEILGSVFIIFTGVYIYFRCFLYNYWRKKDVTYLEPSIPVGNLGKVLAGKMSIGELYAKAYGEKMNGKKKKNRYFGMYTFHKPSLVITDPDLIKFIITKEFVHFHDRGMHCNEEIDPLSTHLFGLSGLKWRTLRAKLSPTFTSGKLKRMFPIILDIGDNLTRHLKPIADKRQVVDMKDLFARLGTDVIMSVAFGISCNSVDHPNCEFRYWGRKIVALRSLINALSMFAPRVIELLSIPLIDKGVTKFFTNVFKETVEYREANNIKRPDFMNLLMQLMKRGYVGADDDEERRSIVDDVPNGKITMTEATAQAFLFFIAGFESTSSTMTTCLYEMAGNQNIQDKLIKDIDVALEKFDGRLTYAALEEMTYFNKVFAETLRKCPPISLLNRVCTKDIDLPSTNFHVSKGLDVVIPVLGLHRDPEIYPNPDKFDPERFNEANIAARHPYAYLPFGEGPRTCIGMRFSYALSKIGIISVLSKYRVKIAPNTRVPLEFDPGNLVLTTKCPVELVIEPR